jgi:D-beta-D-heptose 7-phosphate kinase / D-beta-D-heptose 1-phosphate adenosyltransferase
MTPHIVVVGDVLLDREIRGRADRLCPDAPVPVVEDATSSARAGGAGLAASLAARDGWGVTLVTALAGDAAGDELRRLLDDQGIETVGLGMTGDTPEKIRIGAIDRSLLRLDQGTGMARQDEDIDLSSALGTASAVVVSDYGRGVAAVPAVRRALKSSLGTVPLVWDPHPRGPVPVAGARLATPNLGELQGNTEVRDRGLPSVAQSAEHLRVKWKSAALCVTLGPRGALLVDGSALPMVVPAPRAVNADPCGAGDRFAVSAAQALGTGALVSEAVTKAVEEATRFIASGAIRDDGAPQHSDTADMDAFEAAATVRARGGTVVATGGCFDLLHAGHIALVKAAARLGDMLVVCVNSDASVRRLKGRGRPYVPETDRAEVLRSIEGVDGVVIFDEDTPAQVLDKLRPHVFVKGGDYGGVELPESEVLSRWGGRAMVLPYLEGKSTTALAEEVMRRGRI